MSSGYSLNLTAVPPDNDSGAMPPSGPFTSYRRDWRQVMRRLLREYAQSHPEFLHGNKVSLRQFALAIGSDPSTIWSWLDKEPPKEPSFASLAKLMDFLGQPLTLLVEGENKRAYNIAPAGNANRAKLVGIVEAGVWREPKMIDLDDDVIVPFVHDPRFGGLQQFAWKVSGHSLNRLVSSGSYIITVRFIDINREPTDGDLVICKRTRRDEVEYTVKRVRYDKRRPRLVPESTDPRFQEPIWLRSDETEPDVEVAAEHLVIGAFKPL